MASYLSPPIAMVYCLAIAWPRMNELGAFWSLMYGLGVGLVRMVLDFTYPEPLCMELDDRPVVVRSVHYMYFAAGLFLTTGVVGAVISLLTPPPRDYMVSTLSWLQALISFLSARPDDLPDQARPESQDG